MRVHNFSPGPATLPLDVLEKAKSEFLDWQGSGMSVMEMSHRGEHFMSIAQKAEDSLRKILGISDEYKILFLQGGASMQFSMVPMNLSNEGNVDYVNTGSWSTKSIQEAQKYATVNVAATSEESDFTYIPDQSTWNLSKNSQYLHYTANETIHGNEFSWVPESDVPLVSDMSSTILSRPLDVSKFSLLYAGAQKNMGPSGITIVIMREDLIGNAIKVTPKMLDYKTHSSKDSMYNTPPTFSWYIAGLYFEWIQNQGGLGEMDKRNEKKSKMLYDAIDSSDFYSNPVNPKDRSRMNVVFRLSDDSLEDKFASSAQEKGLIGLRGHRSVGGMRASIYNAMSLDGVESLVSFMKDFEEMK